MQSIENADGLHRNDSLWLMDSIYQRTVRLLAGFLVFHFSLAYIGEPKPGRLQKSANEYSRRLRKSTLEGENMTVDVLAFGSHPDDLELACGGTIAKLVKQGRKVAMADLTQGELGTRGTKEIRAKEAHKAADVLGAVTRRNLHIPDGDVQVTKENMIKVISLIREVQPKILLLPHSLDRHPDHYHTHQLCKEAWFYAGLMKIETKLEGKVQKPFRPDNFFEFMQWYEFQPAFIVDISDTWETKLDAIRAHSSQLHNPKSKEPETRLTKPEFLENVEIRARNYGRRIGTRYGEPFFSYVPVGIQDVFDLVMNKG